jgi:hypothetical protein
MHILFWYVCCSALGPLSLLMAINQYFATYYAQGSTSREHFQQGSFTSTMYALREKSQIVFMFNMLVKKMA